MKIKKINKTPTKNDMQCSFSYLSLLADLLVQDIYRPATTERKKRVRENLEEMVYKSQRCLQMMEKSLDQTTS